MLPDAQGTLDAVLNGQADACLHDTKVPGFLSLHKECTVLTRDDGQPIIPYKDCVHPCIKPGDQRFLNWLNSWMSFNKASGKFDQIMQKLETVTDKQDEMAQDIAKIKEAVYNPDEGLYARLRELESWKETSTRLIWIIITTVLGLGGAVVFKTFLS